jgi:hypothetical protein
VQHIKVKTLNLPLISEIYIFNKGKSDYFWAKNLGSGNDE